MIDKSPIKLDARFRKEGMPTALKKTQKIPLQDSFIQQLYHIPNFVEHVLQYDESLSQKSPIMTALQKLIVDLIMSKKKETTAEELYQIMEQEYNGRFKTLEEFIKKLIPKVEDALEQYNSILSVSVHEYKYQYPIKDLFEGKIDQHGIESSFWIIKLQDVENLTEDWNKLYVKEQITIKKAPKILTFQIENQTPKFVFEEVIYLDRLLLDNQENLQDEQINDLKSKREDILKQIKELENYNNTGVSITYLLEQTISIVQTQRDELLDGDPAVEAICNLIIDANQKLQELKNKLNEINSEINNTMINFQKNKYVIHAVIVSEGDYESAYIRWKKSWFCFEDSHVELKDDFDINSLNPTNIVVIYKDGQLKSQFTPSQGRNLFDFDEESFLKPYTELVRKDLQQIASQINRNFEQELASIKQQQQAEEVNQQYFQRYNSVVKILNMKTSFNIPPLANFAVFLSKYQNQMDDYVLWQILDCAMRDVIQFTIHEIRQLMPFAQRLKNLFQSHPHKTPSILIVQQRDMQIMNFRLSEYIQAKQIANILIHGIQCALENKILYCLVSLKTLLDFGIKNPLSDNAYDIFKIVILSVGINLFQTCYQQQYLQLWESLQILMAFHPTLPDRDLVAKQNYRFIKDILNKSNKKTFNSDQIKIIKKFISLVDDKKQIDISANLLLQRDETLQKMCNQDYETDHYYWKLDNKDNISDQLATQIKIFRTEFHYALEFYSIIQKTGEIVNYDDRLKIGVHIPI